jgi:hypothetical protein
MMLNKIQWDTLKAWADQDVIKSFYVEGGDRYTIKINHSTLIYTEAIHCKVSKNMDPFSNQHIRRTDDVEVLIRVSLKYLWEEWNNKSSNDA